MYTFIIDPSNNNKYNINSKEAKRLLKKYINVIYGGANQEELPKKKKIIPIKYVINVLK